MEVEIENKDGRRVYPTARREIKLYDKQAAFKILAEYIGLVESSAPKVAVVNLRFVLQEEEAI